jgi:hypothetical protein
MSGGFMTEQISVPARATELAGLDSVDYADAFAAATTAIRTPEAWLRSVTDSAPMLMGLVRQIQHHALGLRLAPTGSPGQVIGWDILHSKVDACVLGASGGIGTARIVLLTSPGQVVVATLLRYDHVGARLVWAVVAPVHRAVARYLLVNGVRNADTAPAGADQ